MLMRRSRLFQRCLWIRTFEEGDVAQPAEAGPIKAAPSTDPRQPRGEFRPRRRILRAAMRIVNELKKLIFFTPARGDQQATN